MEGFLFNSTKNVFNERTTRSRSLFLYDGPYLVDGLWTIWDFSSAWEDPNHFGSRVLCRVNWEDTGIWNTAGQSLTWSHILFLPPKDILASILCTKLFPPRTPPKKPTLRRRWLKLPINCFITLSLISSTITNWVRFCYFPRVETLFLRPSQSNRERSPLKWDLSSATKHGWHYKIEMKRTPKNHKERMSRSQAKMKTKQRYDVILGR